jgi:hypothetical protein
MLWDPIGDIVALLPAKVQVGCAVLMVLALAALLL